MYGKYIFKSNGEIIAESKNILTNNGKSVINQYLGDATNEWAGTMAVGVFYTAAAATDTQLQYEVYRTPVTSKSYITTSGSQIVVKATCDPTLVASIYEIGIIPQNYINTLSKDNYVLTDFSEITGSPASGAWLIGGTANTASYRSLAGLGTSRSGAYNIIVPSGSVAISNLTNSVDFSPYNTNDYVSLLYYISATAAGTSSVSFTFTDDNGVTWQSANASLNSAATGYYTASLALNTPGTNFDYNVVSITASVWGGAASPNFDNLKMMSGDVKTNLEQLVSRSACATPIVTTTYGQPLEIEYYLTVN